MPPRDEQSARLQRAIESLFEDERLRSNLTDAEAQVLLDWAQAQVEEAANATTRMADAAAAQASIDTVLRQVRAAIREINDLTGDKDRLSDAQMRERLLALAATEGEPAQAVLRQTDELVAQRGRLNNQEFVTRLTALASLAKQAQGRPVAPETPTPRPRSSLGCAGAVLAILVCGLCVLGAFLIRWRSRSMPSPAATLPPISTPQAEGWYQAFFTAPKYPDNSSEHKGGLDERLTAFINTARVSVDMAIYQLDLQNVTQALLDAKQRGCTVRIVTDIDILDDPKENPAFQKLQAAGISIVAGNSNAIMHDKFVVVDGQAVWTGSWNFTENDTYRYNNNAILIYSMELARNYTVTFEKMWRDKQFGPSRKPGGTQPHLSIDGITVENYFAPEDKVTEKIIARLTTAQRSIDFMAFAFTDDAIGDVVRARAQAGVKVRGVFETTGSETKYSEYGRMKAAGLDVLQDGNPYLMHHKVFIVDGRTVMLGSFNFSQNAENSNDENLLIVDDAELAAQFGAEFERVYAQAKNPPHK